jgi:Ran GTPase-activating protein (RanGAP) involved in mRNA processing and transport
MKNKQLHTIEISGCRTDYAENLELFLQKIDQFSTIRYLVLDNMQPDLSVSLEVLGEALAQNTKLEVLIMRENRMKWIPYAAFWENIKPNTSLKKINVSKTEINDRVLEPLCSLLCNPAITLVDLDLSRNLISDVGLATLGTALSNNKSIKFLNLAQNTFKDVGLKTFVQYLNNSDCGLVELSLMGNKINNEGIKILSEFVKVNKSLKMLDLGRNMFGDIGFKSFALELGAECILSYLDISKNRDLSDEGSLIILAQQLAHNKYLQTLDLSGLRIRKPFLKQFFEPSLKKNCTLKYVVGNITPDIIDQDLRVNIQIENEVEPNFSVKPKSLGPKSFNLKEIDPENTTSLNMRDKDASLFDAALKYVRYKDIRQIDFSNMALLDTHLY